MKGRIAPVCVPAAAVGTAVGAIVGAVVGGMVSGTPPANAATEPSPAADLRVVYENPEIAKDNSGVTWHWVLTNRGTAGAETIVATHHVSAGQRVVGASAPCAGNGSDVVVCRFASIRPGERRDGWIKTAVTPTSDTLRVNAQVTWREKPSVLPELGDPVEAADTSGTDSRGVSDTDVATGMPGQTVDPRSPNVA